jgi:hypothetical protein
MTSHSLLSYLALLPGVVVFVELFRLLPVARHVQAIRKNAVKAFTVILSPRISDHWKEKSIPAYAGKILLSSLIIAFYLAVICLLSGLVAGVIGLLVVKDMSIFFRLILNFKIQAGLVAAAIVYVWLRPE